MGRLNAFINIRKFRTNLLLFARVKLAEDKLCAQNVDNIPISCLISKPTFIQVAILMHTLWAYCAYD